MPAVIWAFCSPPPLFRSFLNVVTTFVLLQRTFQRSSIIDQRSAEIHCTVFGYRWHRSRIMNRAAILPIPIPCGGHIFFVGRGVGREKIPKFVFRQYWCETISIGPRHSLDPFIPPPKKKQSTGGSCFFFFFWGGGFDVIPGAHELVRNARQQMAVVVGGGWWARRAFMCEARSQNAKKTMQVTTQNGVPRWKKSSVQNWFKKLLFGAGSKPFFQGIKCNGSSQGNAKKKRHFLRKKTFAGETAKNATIQQKKNTKWFKMRKEWY